MMTPTQEKNIGPTIYPPGMSGNPEGRAVGTTWSVRGHLMHLLARSPEEVMRILDRDAAKVPIAKLIAARRIMEACQEGTDGLAAAKLVMEHTDGKPTERIQLQVRDTRSVEDRMAAIRARLESVLEGNDN